MRSSTSSSSAYLLVVGMVVLLPVLGFVIGNEALIRTKVEPQDTFAQHLRFWEQARSPNVILGDSHTSNDLTGIPGFENLSYGSDTPLLTEAKVLRYFESRKPAAVILEADPHYFAPYVDKADYPERERAYTQGMRLPLRMVSAEHRGFLWRYWQEWWHGGFKNIYSMEADGAFTHQDRWLDFSAQERERLVRDRVALQVPTLPIATTRSAGALQQTVAYLVAKGAHVCLVTTPVVPEMATQQDAIPAYAAAAAFYEEMAARYNVRHVDLSRAIGDESLFANQDHLNRDGALLLSPMVKKACFDALGR